jgi:lipopolysaccharide transport system ATP-binding protein
MTTPIISVENLGKRYTIRHEAGRPTGSYRRLSEELLTAAKAPFRALASKFGRGAAQPSPNAASTEDFWALRDVWFDVKEGEVLGIIGRNGAGKSTLLKILSRITEPSEGRVRIRGRVASLLEVGTGFHPELTGRENIFLNGSVLGMTRAEISRRFDEIVAFAEVERFLDTPVKRYSSGMYVRLAFAVAAHLDPEILVVDEVLSVGDAEFQKKCLGQMSRIGKAGRTVLFVSHQLGSLRQLCNRGLLIERGRATCHDSMESALNDYLTNLPGRSQAPAEARHIREVTAHGSCARNCHVVFGASMRVSIVLSGLTTFPCACTLTIRDSLGNRICLFSTNPHDGVEIPSAENVRVTFTMEFFPFAPGEYDIDVAVTEPTVRIIEEAVGALRLSVLPVVLGGTLPYGAPYGMVFPKHSWKVETI